MSKSEIEVQDWFLSLIHDQKRFTARWARKYSEITGIEVEMLVKGAVFFLIGLLLVSKQPHYIANALLVIAPIIVTYVEPAERPSPGTMFVYWSLFGFSVLFDRVLEYIPIYYIVKLIVFIALFLPPSNPVIERIREKLDSIAPQQ